MRNFDKISRVGDLAGFLLKLSFTALGGCLVKKSFRSLSKVLVQDIVFLTAKIRDRKLSVIFRKPNNTI
jgi:hypothetical protein